MSRLGRWYGGGGRTRVAVTGQRAAKAWLRILDRPYALTLYRASVALDEQTVRLEYDSNQASESMGEAGKVGRRGLIIFGIVGHPTLDDTDIERGDRFVYGGDTFEVEAVLTLDGQIQAQARRLES